MHPTHWLISTQVVAEARGEAPEARLGPHLVLVFLVLERLRVVVP